jgi:hypothetical protein
MNSMSWLLRLVFQQLDAAEVSAIYGLDATQRQAKASSSGAGPMTARRSPPKPSLRPVQCSE